MKSAKSRILWQLFWSFFKIGPITFGGGYAVIPVIERELVDKQKWVKKSEMDDVIAVASSLPGAIAINSATFIGYRLAGIRGAVAALLGIFLPTFLIVIGISIAFYHVQDHPKVEAAFQAIRITVIALIVYAAYSIGKKAIFDKTTLSIVSASLFCLLFLHIHPALLIIIGIFLGIFIIQWKEKLGYLQKTEETNREERKYEWFMGEGI
ncbi:chromate transporter [Alkalihalobacterium bogoriense]|uniref:chromate transporter n=1 Tax=Alkalihalobacterium bogoriense TaxID=246272 RepID=UPI00047DC248|nr:chromate transporter [Alkalihalobacterium bogoriense]